MQSPAELEQPISSIVVSEPTPVEEIVAALRKIEPLEGLTESEYRWLAENGIERKVGPGIMLFREGDPPAGMYIMLKGEVHVRRKQSGNISFFIAKMGQLSGILPFSRMKGYGGTGFSVGEVWTLDIPKETFPAMLQAIPSMAQRCVSVLLNRVREVTRMEMQAEKLNALGKLAANLAHELNNPASAAQRAAASLFGELRDFGTQKQRLGAALEEAGQYNQYENWVQTTREKMANYNSRAILPNNPMDLSDREDIFRKWLEEHGVENAWNVAGIVAESPLTLAHLQELAKVVSPQALAVSVGAFSSSLNVERMAEVVLNSTVRIFDLISAIKDYSYMDQAPIQEVDLAQSLDSTLSMFSSRLEHVKVERDYSPELPCISAYGSELNQVWTELIQNALEAMSVGHQDGMPHGTLKIRATPLGTNMVSVEVWDSGPEIAPEIQTRIFEPFFTTKAPGQGLGLGLDSVNRIVQMHSGVINVQSVPGSTCFQVRLPVERVETY